MNWTLKCSVCGTIGHHTTQMTCEECGIWGILEVEMALELPNALAVGMERYLPLLPIPEGAKLPPVSVGNTAVCEAPRLADFFGLSRLRLKDEGRNPSGSLKDRASWMGAVHAGNRTVACASTGNAASSLAAMCASLGQKAMIFVPERAPAPKLAQLQVFGATVFRVAGNYDQAYDLCAKAIEHYGWYSRSAAVNPYLVEGKKTCGLEIAELEAADWVAISVGDGCTIAGIWKGLKEMHALGVLSRLPRLLGVQAQGAPAVFEEWLSDGDNGPARPPKGAGAQTLADSISVGIPRNWRRAVRSVQESGGKIVCVSDTAIMEAMRLTARLGGVYGEPAGATAVAGLADSEVTGSVVAVVSGSGLKDVAGAQAAGGDPHDVSADLKSVFEILDA
jgi:threonine synthase